MTKKQKQIIGAVAAAVVILLMFITKITTAS